MEDAQQLAEAVFESLRRHVMMARLAPSGGAVMALLKVRQSYSVSRHRQSTWILPTETVSNWLSNRR